MSESNKLNEFKKELTSLLKRYGWEGASDTPDYILADYVERCLNSYCFARRNAWQYIKSPKEEE